MDMELSEELLEFCQPIEDCFDWNYHSFTDQSHFNTVTDETLAGLATDETLLVPGTDLYKKVRKRRQNRESAARIRMRRRKQEEEGKKKLTVITDLNNALSIENVTLRSENMKLKDEIEYYKSIISANH